MSTPLHSANKSSRYVFVKKGSLREFEAANWTDAIKRLAELTNEPNVREYPHNGWKHLETYPAY